MLIHELCWENNITALQNRAHFLGLAGLRPADFQKKDRNLSIGNFACPLSLKSLRQGWKYEPWIPSFSGRVFVYYIAVPYFCFRCEVLR
jgi:hypothetical protein